MMAIIKKELRSYFYSPVAYILGGLWLIIMGSIFTKFVEIYVRMNNGGRGQGITLDKMAVYLYQNMAFWLCVLTPFVTMRLFAEEKRQQTFELLFTSPIRGFELVLGKFFSALILLSIMVGISFVYVFFMILWGNPDLKVIATTYVGLILALCCYVSIGALISATTNSQAIAAVITFVVLLMLWLLQSLSQGMTVRWDTALGIVDLGTVLAYISPLSHYYDSFSEGLVHVKDVIYFFTFTGFTLFVTHRVVESNRWR